MRDRRKFLAAAIMAAMILIAAPGKAQERSRSAHITLIARMPETLSFSVNTGKPPDSFDGQQTGPQVADSVTANWVLGKGRTQIVTWAHVKRQPTPVLLALASISNYGDPATDGPSSFHLPAQPLASSSRLDSLRITDANRVAANTLSLSDVVSPSAGSQSDEDGYIGTIKIQIQALP